VIDFGDQLWLLHRWNLQPVEKDFVLLDEIQDANPAQLALYKKLVGTNGRAIAVGDSRQAIQGFAFAAPQMWQQVEVELDTETLPLSVCYRCPSSHLDLARSIVPQLRQEKMHPSALSRCCTLPKCDQRCRRAI
jgi:superfamily I DNA/RNA helicase